MKHLSIGIIFAALLATVFVSCRQGDQGEPGPSGATGAAGALLPYKSGSITGTLTGQTYQSGEDFTKNLNFQYFKGPLDNNYNVYEGGTNHNYIITRYDSTGNSYITFDFTVQYYEGQNGNSVPEIVGTDITIVTTKPTGSTNNIVYFGTHEYFANTFDVGSVYLASNTSGNSNNITYDNLSVNETTGAISFDYALELSYPYNSSGNDAYMEGSLSATPYNVSYREGSNK